MGIELHWSVQFQQGQIVFEGGRIVLPVDDDTLHILRHRALTLQVAGDVEFAHDGHQWGQETGGKSEIRD